MNEATFEARVHAAAMTAHHANQGYALVLGDSSQKHWNDAEEWQRQAAIDGARAILSGRINSASAAQQEWADQKRAAGWTYGPVKSGYLKTHPLLVPFDELPHAERQKDVLFFSVVNSFKEWEPQSE